MSVINFKDYKKSLNKPKYTSAPKTGKNMYVKNLEDRITYFENKIGLYANNPIIEKCEFSVEGCAIKFCVIEKNLEILLILQDYSPEESDNYIVTWEFYIHNIVQDEYIDSKFFSSSDMAINYFLSKIKYTT